MQIAAIIGGGCIFVGDESCELARLVEFFRCLDGIRPGVASNAIDHFNINITIGNPRQGLREERGESLDALRQTLHIQIFCRIKVMQIFDMRQF